MQPGRIFVTAIAVVDIFVGIFLLHANDQEKRRTVIIQSNPQKTTALPLAYIPPDISEKYVRVIAMGYGFATHAKSKARRMGITVYAEYGQQTLIPTSQADDFLLNNFFKRSDGPNLESFAASILHQAHILKDTTFVSFETDELCQARFHQKEKVTCTTARDAVAICMVFAKTRLPLLFAHKDLFLESYWESLFATPV